jgi:hypothetical protein
MLLQPRHQSNLTIPRSMVCLHLECSCDAIHSENNRFDTMCKHGDKCTFANCWYRHPDTRPVPDRILQLCRYNAMCNNPLCQYIHPENQLVEFHPRVDPDTDNSETGGFIRMCRYGDTCHSISTSKTCAFSHEKSEVLCKYKEACYKLKSGACLFSHNY